MIASSISSVNVGSQVLISSEYGKVPMVVVSTRQRINQKGSKYVQVRHKRSDSLIHVMYISFGGHQSQTIERMKALYDMYKCILIIFWEKRGFETLQKNVWNFCDSFLVFLIVKSFYSY